MRILMLNHNVRGKSTFFRAFHLGRWLVRMGHHVTLVTVSPTERFRFRESEECGVRVVESPDLLFGSLRSGWDPIGVVRRIAFLYRTRFDIIHAFDCRPAVVLPALFKKWHGEGTLIMDWADWWGRGGAITQRHGLLNRLFAPVETFFEERFRPMADGLTLTSTALYERAAAMDMNGAPITRLPSGANVDLIEPMDKTAARQTLGLDRDKPMVLYCGFVNYDVDLVLRAFHHLLQRVPTARLMLVGTSSRTAQPLIETLGLAPRIDDFGVQPYNKMPVYFGASDVCLLPLTRSVCNEGRDPIRLGDYLAGGRPIVTNPVGDVGRTLSDTNFAILSEDTPEAYGDAIANLLTDPERAKAMGSAARQFAENSYSWERTAARLERFYDDVLSAQQGHRTPARVSAGDVS